MLSVNQQKEDRYERVKAQWRKANHRYYEKMKDNEDFKRKRSLYHKARYQRLKALRELEEARVREAYA